MKRRMLVARAALATAAAVVACVGSSPAQSQPSFGARWEGVPKTPKSPATPAPQPQSKAAVSLEQALYLIRSTLLTLNDANRSGNYTVLRELAAPSFQSKNSAADLGVIFSDLRGRKIDLFAVALMAPQLFAAPQIDGNGMLRLTGAFPTRPLQISFDLLFQSVDGQWRLFGISVQTPQAQVSSQPPSSTAAPPATPRGQP
jgi:hypothetical protein